MSTFWSIWITVLTVISLIGFVLLLFGNRKTSAKKGEQAKTGHIYDGIEEYDNPLPSWWFNLFILSIIYGVLYLVAYPGLGNFAGLLGWTSTNQWEKEVAIADKKYGAIFAKYAAMPIEALASERKAMKMGQRLFSNSCSTCHGTDAAGAMGYPNLTDNDWLYGGTPEQIKTTITHGRIAVMPSWRAVLNINDLTNVANYVHSLSTNKQSEHPGMATFNSYCAACHTKEGTGNIVFGAPDLTDNTWLYGGSEEEILNSIASGRTGTMPAHKALLSSEKVHILTAYVYSLSQTKN